MFESWPIVVMGWPAVLASVILCGIGIAQERPKMVLLGAALALPFCFYLALTPAYGLVAPVAAVLYLGAAYPVAKKQAWLGGLAMVPFLLMAGTLAFAVWAG